jgi:hypothetical protein
MTAIRILQRLSELVDDVTISSIANTDVLIYNSSTSKWENITPSGATGVIGYWNKVGTTLIPTTSTDSIRVNDIYDQDEGNLSINIDERLLLREDGTTTVCDWQESQLLDNANGRVSVDWDARILVNIDSQTTVNYDSTLLIDGLGTTRVDWLNGYLNDNTGNLSVDWGNRFLKASDGSDTILDWSTAGTAAFGDSNITTTGTATATGGLRTKVSVDNINDPPTDEDLDSAFGTPAALGEGFVGILDDNSADTDVYICYTSDTSWFYIKGTKASPA